MTFDEAKNQIAREEGYENWEDLEDGLFELDDLTITANIFEKIATLYARSKHDEACEAQRKLCKAEFTKAYMNDKNFVITKRIILNAPKPEFKP